MSLIVYCLHQALLTYTARPPPLIFPDCALLSVRTSENPSNPRRASGTLWCSHVSVNTIKLQVRYSKHALELARSSSILPCNDLALHSIIAGKGGLFPCRRRRCRIPPRWPRLLCLLCLLLRSDDGLTQTGRFKGGGPSW